MDVVVFLKQVFDNTRMTVDAQGQIAPSSPKMMNPLDEYALEQALGLKDADPSLKLTVVCASADAGAKEMLKKAIAAGADQAVLITDESVLALDGLSRAKLLSAAVATLAQKALIGPEAQALFLFGNQALDTGAGETGPAFAALKGIASLAQVRDVTLDSENPGCVQAKRADSDGVESHRVALPCVLTAIKGGKELRSSNIKGVMRANKTEIPVWGINDLGLSEAIGALRPIETLPREAKPSGQTLNAASATEAAEAIVQYLASLQAV